MKIAAKNLNIKIQFNNWKTNAIKTETYLSLSNLQILALWHFLHEGLLSGMMWFFFLHVDSDKRKYISWDEW